MPATPASTRTSFQGASLLTGLPVVAYGACAFGASALARLVGEARGVAAGLVTIVAGIVRDATRRLHGLVVMLVASLVAMIGLTVVFAPRSYEQAMRRGGQAAEGRRRACREETGATFCKTSPARQEGLEPRPSA